MPVSCLLLIQTLGLLTPENRGQAWARGSLCVARLVWGGHQHVWPILHETPLSSTAPEENILLMPQKFKQGLRSGGVQISPQHPASLNTHSTPTISVWTCPSLNPKVLLEPHESVLYWASNPDQSSYTPLHFLGPLLLRSPWNHPIFPPFMVPLPKSALSSYQPSVGP